MPEDNFTTEFIGHLHALLNGLPDCVPDDVRTCAAALLTALEMRRPGAMEGNGTLH